MAVLLLITNSEYFTRLVIWDLNKTRKKRCGISRKLLKAAKFARGTTSGAQSTKMVIIVLQCVTFDCLQQGVQGVP